MNIKLLLAIIVSLLSITLASAGWNSGLSNDLVSYYAFENSNLDNVSNFDLTLRQTKFNATAGRVGNGIAIDNTSSQIGNYDYHPNWNMTNWTISGWGLQHTTPRGAMFTNQYNRTVGTGYITYGTFTSNLKVEEEGGPGFDTPYNVSNNTWNLYTITYNKLSNNLSIYLNNALINSTTAVTTIGTNSNTLFFGTWGAALSQTWNGYLDEIGVWNRTLSRTEVTQLWNGGTGITYQFSPPSITTTLNSPSNATSTTLNSSIQFNSTLTPDTFSLTNATLYLWWNNGTSYDTLTNTSFNGNISLINYSNFQFGTFLWNVLGVQGNGNGTNSSFSSGNRSITISKAVEDTQSYSASVLEQTTTSFKINVSLSSGYSISAVYLNWNGTNTTASFSAINSTTYQGSINKFIPSVTADGVVPFFWYVVLTDGSMFNSSQNTQTVVNFGLDNCVANTIQILNATLKDEQNQSKLNATAQNTSIKINLLLYSFANLTGNYINYSASYTQTNPARVCMNSTLSSSEFYMSGQIQYTANEHATEFYNIQNYSLNATNNPSENLSLYDLKDASNQVFTITYKDANYLAVPDALVQISRKYVDEGTFKTVEIPITDAQGSTVANLEVNNAIYTFTVTKYGRVLSTFTNFIAQCQNPLIENCEINLNAFQSSIPVTNFTVEEDFLYTLTYNNNTRIITATFTIPSGASSQVFLNVTQTDALGTSICNEQVTTSSGSLTCTVVSSFGNGTVIAYLYKDGDLIAYGQINLQQKPQQLYGGGLVFLGILLFLTLIGASVSDNPIMMIVSFIIGVILLMGLNVISGNGFIGGGATILFLVVAIIIVLLKASKRS